MMKKIALCLVLMLFVVCIFASGVMGWKRYDGVQLKWLIPAGHNAWILRVHEKDVKKDLGIELIGIEANEEEIYEKMMTDWMVGGGSYDLVTLPPYFNGESMGQGYFIPIGEYIEKVDGGKDAYNDIASKFRILCAEWQGEPYAYPQDGDVFNLYYRKDILTNPEYQKRFKEKYGYNMPVPPETMDQLIDVSEFLKGWDWDNDGKVEYGYSQNWKVAQSRFVFPLFGAATGGKLLMDENMNPELNVPAIVKALNDYRRLLHTGPPGAVEYGWAEGPGAFINGEVAFHLFYPDVAKMIYTPGWTGDPKEVGPHWKERIGYAPFPGYIVDGKLFRYTEISGKVIGVTKFSEYPEAAVAALAYISHPDRNHKTIDSSTTGSDAWSISQLSKKAYQWSIPIDQEFIDLVPELMESTYPLLFIPGAAEYYDALETNVRDFLTDPNKKAANILAKIEKEWDKITDRRGRKEQMAFWSQFVENCKRAGLGGVAD